LENNQKKGVIYTCITGGYDDLSNHTFVNQDWDYVCFTDDLSIRRVANSFWQIRPLLFDKHDNVRNQRWHKIHPHILFPGYVKSVWLDANINILNKDLFADIDMAIAESRLISIAPHPVRKCIYDELITCLELGKDDEAVMRKQVDLIRNAGYPEKNGLFENNIMYRDHHNDRVIETMKDWWWWIEGYSRRDQLSLNYVLWQHRFEVKPLTNISYRYGKGIEFTSHANHVTGEKLTIQGDQLQQDLLTRDNQNVGLNHVPIERDAQIAGHHQTMEGKDSRIDVLYQSIRWQLTRPLRNIRWLLKSLRRMINSFFCITYEPDVEPKISQGFGGEKLQVPDENGDDPLISIVIPVYNACRHDKKFILCALESIANQSYKKIELIIVDDGSTDDSREICDDFLSTRPDLPARYFSKKNGGQSSARNYGIKNCSGEYVAFLDQDDEWYPDKLERIVPWLRNKSIDMLYTDADIIDGDGKMTQEAIHKNLLAGWPHPKKAVEDILFKDIFVMPGLMTIRSKALEKVGGFDENLSGYEDDDLFLRVFEQCRIFYLPVSTLRWRMYNGNYSFSSRMLTSRLYYWKKLMKKYAENSSSKIRAQRISLRFFWQFVIQATYQYSDGNDLYAANIRGAREIVPYLPMRQRLLAGFIFRLPLKYTMRTLVFARKSLHLF